MSDLFTNVESDQILKTHGLPKPANLFSEDALDIYLRFSTPNITACICNIEYNHDNNNNKKNILKQEHVLNSWTLPNVHVPDVP